MPDLRFGGTLARTCIYGDPGEIWNPAGYSNTISANVYFDDGYSLHDRAGGRPVGADPFPAGELLERHLLHVHAAGHCEHVDRPVLTR
jgi:hypothetical protein